MDYLQIQKLLAGIDSASAAKQLAEQNPTIDPHMLMPQLTQAVQDSAAASDAGTLPVPGTARTGPGAAMDWTKALTGAKGMLTPTPQQPVPTAHPFAIGSAHLSKPNVVLPGGPTNTGTSFGQLMGARKNAY